MRKPIVTDAFTASLKMNLLSMPSSSKSELVSGFAIWFLNDKPRFPEKFGRLFGFNDLWNGSGIFITHDSSSGSPQWRLTITENFGVMGLMEKDILEMSTEENSCVMDYVNTGSGKFYLQIKVRNQRLTIKYGRKNTSRKLCVKDY